jgi:GDP-D-mannose dehydratase
MSHIFESVELHYGDLTILQFVNIIKKVQPDEVYNLGAQSSC